MIKRFRRLLGGDTLVLRQGAASTALRMAALVGRFALVWLLGFFLPVEQVGVYGLVTAAVSIAETVVDLSFRDYSTRDLLQTNSSSQQARRIRDQIVTHLLTYIVSIPILLSAIWAGILPPEHALWFIPVLITDHLHTEFKQFLVVFRKPILANLSVFIARASWIFPLGLIWLLLPESRTVETVWAGWVGGNLLSMFMSWRQLGRLPWRRAYIARIDWRWIRRGLWIAAPFLVGGILTTLNKNLDRFILHQFVPLSELGVFSFYAAAANGIFSIAIAGQGMIFMPLALRAWSRGDFEAYRRAHQQMVYASVLGTVGIALAASFAIQLMLPYLKSPMYGDFLPTLWVLMASLVMTAAGNAAQLAIYVRGLDRGVLVAATASFAVTIGLDFLLIPRMGILGAACAQFAGQSVIVAVKMAFWYANRHLRPGDTQGSSKTQRSGPQEAGLS